MKTIEVTRKPDQDAAQLAAETAKANGTKLNGNMRWQGATVPAFREIATQDGRTIRVLEPR